MIVQKYRMGGFSVNHRRICSNVAQLLDIKIAFFLVYTALNFPQATGGPIHAYKTNHSTEHEQGKRKKAPNNSAQNECLDSNNHEY